MRRSLALLAVVALPLLLGSPANADDARVAATGTLERLSTAPVIDRTAAAQLLVLVNAERSKRGLPVVADDPALRGWAEAHSVVMARTGVLHHNDSLFTREAHRVLGIKVFAENVAWDDDPSPGIVGAHTQFMGSPHHHDNVLGSTYRLAGIAVARDLKGRIWVTENFGTARAATVAPPPVAPRAPRPVAPRPAMAAPRRPATARPPAPAPAPSRRRPVTPVPPALPSSLYEVRDPSVATDAHAPVRAVEASSVAASFPISPYAVSALLPFAVAVTLGRRRRRRTLDP